jgi:hypothetical protein
VDHVHVPIFFKRHVLVNAAPGVKVEPSGTVKSETNCAWSQIAALTLGTDWTTNKPTSKTMLISFRLNMAPPFDSPAFNDTPAMSANHLYHYTDHHHSH